MAAVAVALWSVPAYGETRADVGLLLGSTQATDEATVLQFKRATTYQATFHLRLWTAGAATIGVELPFIASPAVDVDSNVGSRPKEYASLYLTPGLRATFLVDRPLSLFVAGGRATPDIPNRKANSTGRRTRDSATRTPAPFSSAVASTSRRSDGSGFAVRCATSGPARATSRSRRLRLACTTWSRQVDW